MRFHKEKPKKLTHCTKSAGAVRNILNHGFAWVPNKRNLIQSLLPEWDQKGREPQEFGMISFTENEIEITPNHREKFGHFGIVVSSVWATSQAAQRVIYVDHAGPVFEALQTIFQIGYIDLKTKIESQDDEFLTLSSTNKSFASSVVGPRLWPNLAQLYEYMEPSENSFQREWRIVNPVPFYGFKGTLPKIIEDVSPPLNWANLTNVVPVSPKDIVEILCPSRVESELRSSLPDSYLKTKIRIY